MSKENSRPNDVLPKYFTGGEWKVHKLQKGSRASRTFSKLSRSYVAVPPETGWVGGDPLKNGYKPTGGR